MEGSKGNKQSETADPEKLKAENLLKNLLKYPGTALFVIGTGASQSLGVKPTNDLKVELLAARYGSGIIDILKRHGFISSERAKERKKEAVAAPFEAVLSAYAEWANNDEMAPYLFLCSRLPTESAGRNAPLSITYEVLAHLMAHNIVNHVISLNLEEYAERSLDEELGAEAYTRVETLSAFQKLALSPVGELPRRTLLKPHGSIGRPMTLRSSWDAVRRMEAAKSDALELVLRNIGEKAAQYQRKPPLPIVVFIGTSFSEPDMQAFFRLATAKKLIGEAYFITRGSHDLNAEATSMLECGYVDYGGEAELGEWRANHLIRMESDAFFKYVAEAMKGPKSTLEEAKIFCGAQRHLIRLYLLGKEGLMKRTPENRLLLEVLIFAVRVKGLFTQRALTQCHRVATCAGQLAENGESARKVLEVLLNYKYSGRAAAFVTEGKNTEYPGDPEYYHEGDKTSLVDGVIRVIENNKITPVTKLGSNLSDLLNELLEDIDIDIAEKEAETQFTFDYPHPVRYANEFVEKDMDIIKSIPNGGTLYIITETGEWLNRIPDVNSNLKKVKLRLVVSDPSSYPAGSYHKKRALDLLTNIKKVPQGIEIHILRWRKNIDRMVIGPSSALYFRREGKQTTLSPVYLDKPEDITRLMDLFDTIWNNSTEFSLPKNPGSP